MEEEDEDIFLSSYLPLFLPKEEENDDDEDNDPVILDGDEDKELNGWEWWEEVEREWELVEPMMYPSLSQVSWTGGSPLATLQ